MAAQNAARVHARTKKLNFALLGSHVAVVAAIIGVVGLSYRAPVESSASVQAASLLQQPVLSVDQIAAADVASSAAEYAALSVQTSVQSLADSLNAKTESAQIDSSFLNKPQIVQQSGRKGTERYTTVPGDTVQKVAVKFGISDETVRWANNLASDSLNPNTGLTILPITGILYTVKAGDTAQSIASKYQADPERILTVNDAEITGINAGQVLIVPDGILPTNERPGYRPASSGVSTSGRSRVTVFAGNRYAEGFCTWYAYNRRAELGRPTGSNWGNAITWADYARQGGWNVNKTPAAGAVFQTSAGWQGFGHVGVVERVEPNGDVFVSEMNYGGWYRKSFRTIPANQVGTYNFIHDRL